MGKLDGSCLCGAVTYSCAADPVATAVCHCTECQKQTGTSFSVIVAVPRRGAEARGRQPRHLHHRGDRHRPGGRAALLPRVRLPDRQPLARRYPRWPSSRRARWMTRPGSSRLCMSGASRRSPGWRSPVRRESAAPRRIGLRSASGAGEHGLGARLAADRAPRARGRRPVGAGLQDLRVRGQRGEGGEARVPDGDHLVVAIGLVADHRARGLRVPEDPAADALEHRGRHGAVAHVGLVARHVGRLRRPAARPRSRARSR